MTLQDETKIHAWHAHIYYDPVRTREAAAFVRKEIEQRFAVRVGRWHDVPVGPHPRAMYQVLFTPEHFPNFVPWLALNRHGLTVLIHPETGRPRDDHLKHALWMGEVLTLNADILPEAE